MRFTFLCLALSGLFKILGLSLCNTGLGDFTMDKDLLLSSFVVRRLVLSTKDTLNIKTHECYWRLVPYKLSVTELQ